MTIKGRATGGSATTIVDAGKNFTADIVKDKLVRVIAQGVEFLRAITGNTVDTLTIAALRAAAAASAAVKAASAVTDKLTIAAPAGSPANNLMILLETAATDALAVTKNDDTRTISIKLAKTTVSKNAAALVQAAIQALGTVGDVDVSGFTCTAGGNWDTAAKATGETGAVAMIGGVDAVEVSAGDEYEIAL